MSPAGRIRLWIRDGAAGGEGAERLLDGPIVQVGRGSGNDVVLGDPRVSTLHGRLVLEGERVRFEDLGSTNGSAHVRGDERRPVPRGGAPGVLLAAGDELQLGDADRPSCLRLLEVLPAEPARAQAGELLAEATVVARRALGVAGGQTAAETLHRLLKLLLELRGEEDSLGLARRTLEFLLQALPQAARAQCILRDTSGRFASALCLDARPGGGPAPGVGGAPSQALMQQLARAREALLVEDVTALSGASRSLLAQPSRSLVLAPLVSGEELVGALQVGAGPQARFGERELDLVAVLAGQLSGALSTGRLIERLRDAESRLEGRCAYLQARLGQRPAGEEMIGRSPAMAALRGQIAAVAPSRTTVLVLGETGSGKELVARAIHESSPRAAGPFAAVNCSAIAAGLLESELFGHVRGAFTGAHQARQGLFEVAHGGTLLLDEVGDMPAELQPKLLRVLEEGALMPVGSSRARAVDVRVVAATHRDLERLSAEGRFRQDLLFRLNVFSLRVAPLRERPEDILPLAAHFLARFSAEHGRAHPGLTAQAAAALQSYAWPGNIRELRNELERACLLAPDGAALELGHLSERLGGGGLERSLQGSLKEVMERLEAMVVEAALARHGGNRTRCARALGISRQALVAKIARLGLGADGPDEGDG
ncbi:MAG TPA: sigma 54-interacting transcriptional regulator [Myxococcota bacterium]|nr:sigma 54-interacting transcriptional regulator [Myxococcota bacterium]HRY96017.1 sigma 54-interacting transcriptional regulator [Myxococcota bacterium]HSA23007.1 sigma 54-interacting transcriptional regulator [Myxococcota bacterium]